VGDRAAEERKIIIGRDVRNDVDALCGMYVINCPISDALPFIDICRIPFEDDIRKTRVDVLK